MSEAPSRFALNSLRDQVDTMLEDAQGIESVLEDFYSAAPTDQQAALLRRASEAVARLNLLWDALTVERDATAQEG